MKEALTKAAHDLGFACDDLREALNKAGNVEGIVALALIGRANELRRDVDALLHAHESDTANDQVERTQKASKGENDDSGKN